VHATYIRKRFRNVRYESQNHNIEKLYFIICFALLCFDKLRISSKYYIFLLFNACFIGCLHKCNNSNSWSGSVLCSVLRGGNYLHGPVREGSPLVRVLQLWPLPVVGRRGRQVRGARRLPSGHQRLGGKSRLISRFKKMYL